MPETKLPETTTRSLRVAGNPQARMQQLLRDQAQQDQAQQAESSVQSGAPAVSEPSEDDVLTSRQQDILTDSNIDGKLSIQIDSLIDGQQDSRQSGQSARKKVSKAAIFAPVDLDPVLDPVDAALLQKIGRAYPDLAKEASTLVSSRLPNELVSRLDAAASLVKKHKKNKQDVIARGLILAFEELVKQDGDVAWYE